MKTKQTFLCYLFLLGGMATLFSESSCKKARDRNVGATHTDSRLSALEKDVADKEAAYQAARGTPEEAGAKAAADAARAALIAYKTGKTDSPPPRPLASAPVLGSVGSAGGGIGVERGDDNKKITCQRTTIMDPGKNADGSLATIVESGYCLVREDGTSSMPIITSPVHNTKWSYVPDPRGSTLPALQTGDPDRMVCYLISGVFIAKPSTVGGPIPVFKIDNDAINPSSPILTAQRRKYFFRPSPPVSVAPDGYSYKIQAYAINSAGKVGYSPEYDLP